MTEPTGIADDLPPQRDPQENDDRWWQWPCCPECGRRRQTRCSTCDLGGDDFALAEYIPAAEPLPATGAPAAQSGSPPPEDLGLLLMCPVCEEAFTPTFYRLCEQCGHDFGSGWTTDAPAAEVLTGRVLLVLAGLVLLTLGILVYFWFLFA
jgi:hypothetical protein